MHCDPPIVLDPYQDDARNFLLEKSFACLWDAPGVGKTFPAIAASWEIQQQTPQYPVLVTVPSYLLSLWKNEIHKLYPQATVTLVSGSGAKIRREELHQNTDFVITGYSNWSAKDGAVPRYPVLTDRKWSVMVFDEAHRMRKHSSNGAKHLYKIKQVKCPNRHTPLWMLTGTPMVRSGDDFFTYFHLYDKGRYGSYWKFVREWCVWSDTPWGVNLGNIREEKLPEFSRLIAEFSLRRTVKDVPELESLEFVEQEHFVRMPSSVVTAVKRAKKTYVLQHPDMAHDKVFDGAGALYIAQRQISTDPPTKVKPKLDWLKDFLVDRQGKLVVYCFFKKSAVLVAETLIKAGHNVFVATGDYTPTARMGIVDKWRVSTDGILVATSLALSEGVSLTDAREMVILEHSELPGVQTQIINRVCRRGQNELVRVHHVFAEDTVDMMIRKVLQNRGLGFSQALAVWINEE